jgi:hypothetical protein
MIRYPKMPWRQFLALLAAAFLGALASAALVSVLTLSRIEERWNIGVVSEILVFTKLIFLVTLAHALVLGLPGYFLLRSRCLIGIVSCGGAGFAIGATPFGAMALFSMLVTQDSSSGGKATVINHVPTVAGWIEYVSSVGYIGLLGLFGGVTFGIVIWWCGLRTQAANGNQAIPREFPWRSRTVILFATILTGTVCGLPHLVRDTSCHNIFRDGRTSVNPQIAADINLTADDWTSLKQIFLDFGGMNGLAFRGDEQMRDGRLMWRTLNLCNEAGITIVVRDEAWLTHIHSPLANRGMELEIFELKRDSGWQPLARDLVEKLDAEWPNRLTYRGPQGHAIPKEEALKGRP